MKPCFVLFFVFLEGMWEPSSSSIFIGFPTIGKKVGNDFYARTNGGMINGQKPLTQMRGGMQKNSITLNFRYYFVLECAMLIHEYTLKLLNNLAILIPLIILVVSLYGLTLVEGKHQVYVEAIKKQALWCGYWVGLGKSILWHDVSQTY